jgi:hypothetical protein
MKQVLEGYYEGTMNGVLVRVFRHERMESVSRDNNTIVSEWRVMIGDNGYAGAFASEDLAIQAARNYV